MFGEHKKMEKIVKRTCCRTILLILTLWVLGIIGGFVLEKIWPSEFSITILKDDEIFNNNFGILWRTMGIGLVSVSLWCVPFLCSVGGITGQSTKIIIENYGINGIIHGFLPHAIIEMLSCFCAAFVPIYSWQIILEGFIKKNNSDKRKIVISSLIILIMCILLMCACCLLAAYLEYNVSESFWKKV